MTDSHPLMRNNITKSDLDKVIEHLQQDDPILTQSKFVEQFENSWSKWVGVRFSVFVNSGSSANLITLATLRELYGCGDVILPPLTWSSDVAAVLHNGFNPVFVDINMRNLCMDVDQTIEAITDTTRAVFITHAQGFNGLTTRLLQELENRNIPLIEDVSEAHGAMFSGKRLGAFGLMSNFSFYYAHHLSTIEGGMVCTNNPEVYQILRMFRSHGMVREISDKNTRQEFSDRFPDLNPDFIFAYPAYNVRNTEIGAIIGLNQLTRLDTNNSKRSSNFHIFLENLDTHRFVTDFDVEGSCNYALNIILKQSDLSLRDRIEDKLKIANVEFRRGSAGGGNQIRQPYLKPFIAENDWLNYPIVDHVHFYGWYIGNYPSLGKDEILKLCDLLNTA
jgi:CDP-4-dehydro-6-deoxyglucose reductase, E1